MWGSRKENPEFEINIDTKSFKKIQEVLVVKPDIPQWEEPTSPPGNPGAYAAPHPAVLAGLSELLGITNADRPPRNLLARLKKVAGLLSRERITSTSTLCTKWWTVCENPLCVDGYDHNSIYKKQRCEACNGKKPLYVLTLTEAQYKDPSVQNLLKNFAAILNGML